MLEPTAGGFKGAAFRFLHPFRRPRLVTAGDGQDSPDVCEPAAAEASSVSAPRTARQLCSVCLLRSRATQSFVCFHRLFVARDRDWRRVTRCGLARRASTCVRHMIVVNRTVPCPGPKKVRRQAFESRLRRCICLAMSRLPSPPHSKAAIDAAKLLNLKKFSMSSNMNMEHDSMVVNRLVHTSPPTPSTPHSNAFPTRPDHMPFLPPFLTSCVAVDSSSFRVRRRLWVSHVKSKHKFGRSDKERRRRRVCYFAGFGEDAWVRLQHRLIRCACMGTLGSKLYTSCCAAANYVVACVAAIYVNRSAHFPSAEGSLPFLACQRGLKVCCEDEAPAVL